MFFVPILMFFSRVNEIKNTLPSKIIDTCIYMNGKRIIKWCTYSQGGRGHWTVKYPSSQSFKNMLSYFGSKLWVLVLWVPSKSVQINQ